MGTSNKRLQSPGHSAGTWKMPPNIKQSSIAYCSALLSLKNHKKFKKMLTDLHPFHTKWPWENTSPFCVFPPVISGWSISASAIYIFSPLAYCRMEYVVAIREDTYSVYLLCFIISLSQFSLWWWLHYTFVQTWTENTQSEPESKLWTPGEGCW